MSILYSVCIYNFYVLPTLPVYYINHWIYMLCVVKPINWISCNDMDLVYCIQTLHIII